MRTNNFYSGYALIFGLLLSMSSVAQNMTANVQASYHNRDCIGGSGFCSASNQIVLSSTGNTIVERATDRYITFTVDAESFSEAQLVELFGVPSAEIDPNRMYEFDQNVDVLLNPDIVTAIGAGANMNRIKASPYPMVLHDGVVQITFLLSQN